MKKIHPAMYIYKHQREGSLTPLTSSGDVKNKVLKDINLLKKPRLLNQEKQHLRDKSFTAYSMKGVDTRQEDIANKLKTSYERSG